MSDFRNWLLKQKTRDDPIGAFAIKAYSVKEWDGKQSTLKVLFNDDPSCHKALNEFRNRPTSPKSSARGPYELSYGSFSKVFQTKEEVRDFFKAIKDDNKNKQITDFTRDAVLSLFQYHQNLIIVPDMIIEVKMHAEDANYCFHFNGIDYSYVVPIKTLGHQEDSVRKMKYDIQKFIKTARHMINSQIPETVPGHEHDHVIFFVHLLYDWFSGTSCKISELSYEGSGSNVRFQDEDLSKSWEDYHRTNAILRCIPKEENSKRQPAPIEWYDLY
jgi:hypothetical protein